MPRRLAAIMALIAFAMCLLIGGLRADNAFETTVFRALVAMGGTFVVGLVLGLAAQRMLNEAATSAAEKKVPEIRAKSATDDR
jgi:hypothetical protein